MLAYQRRGPGCVATICDLERFWWQRRGARRRWPSRRERHSAQQAGHATWEDIMQVVEEASSFEELTTLLADKDSVLTRVGRKEVGPVKQLAP